METHFDPPRKASSAIAAALLLVSTPLFAQEAATAPAEPVLTIPVSPVQPSSPLPDTATTANPATITPVTPDAPVTTSNPVIQSLPEQPETPAPATQGDGAERVAQAVQPASKATAATSPAVATPEPAPQEPTAPSAEPEIASAALEDAVPAAAPLPIAAPVANDASRSAPVDTSGDIVNAGLIASLLAMLGLAVLGLVLFRRSKPVAVRKVERPVVERPVVERPVVARPTTAPEAPVEREKVDDIREWAQPVPVSRLRETEGGLPHAGAAIALPGQAPKTRAARMALLDRMVAARPDRANPFVSPKRRRHRAILILQSLGRTFENGVSRIDLSQYPSNWPELARRNMPTAA